MFALIRHVRTFMKIQVGMCMHRNTSTSVSVILFS